MIGKTGKTGKTGKSRSDRAFSRFSRFSRRCQVEKAAMKTSIQWLTPEYDSTWPNRSFAEGEFTMTPEKEQEYREEAERLAMLPATERRQIIAMHREIAAGEDVPEAERQAGLERAATLERLLRLKKKRRKS
jgi:hypothetical protein